jgi:hypothetical protein
MGRELTSQEQKYCVDLLTLYIKERLPGLSPAGEKVPPMRQGG